MECIEERALIFQGLSVPSSSHLEPLQLVKYGPDEHYHLHNDWFPSAQVAAATGGNRKSSFFAYVYARNDTTGGGTNFPYLDAFKGTVDEKWCGIVDCDEPYEKGVTFRPVEGNAVYWENLRDYGKGDQRTLHAGLPVTSGEKIGLNIWTREGPLSQEVRERIEYPVGHDL